MSLMTVAQVSARTGKAKSTIYRDVLAGNFPAPRKDGARTVWLSDDVEAWERALPRMGRSMGPALRQKKNPLKSAG